jgi:hypothetical protein
MGQLTTIEKLRRELDKAKREIADLQRELRHLQLKLHHRNQELHLLTLRLEMYPTNPPRPMGFAVFDGLNIVGEMTIGTVRDALKNWDAAEKRRKPR